MCGIAGYYNFKGSVDRPKFEKMVDMVKHRGPDDRGVFYQGGIALGHRRLAVIDLSESGHQPYLYRNRYVVVFNGEIYNYVELKRKLEQKGYQFVSESDTETLAAAYDCYGKKCVQYFNGMWSFAILDLQKQKLYCSRDRFGVKPFYYYLDDTQFIFGSEIKQILCMLDQKPVANKARLLDFLVCGDQDNTEQTMFAGIMQLRGGYEIEMDLTSHRFQTGQYYELKNLEKQPAGYKENCKKFRRAFMRSVGLRMRADVPVGYCLSGGLDSSSIVSVANKILSEKGRNMEQHAVSSCFEDKEYDEQEYIDEVVKHTDIFSHKIYPDGAQLFDEADRIIWHMDEPFGSTSIYAQWNVFREAKKNGLTVMLDGQGADEQLAGYSIFYGVYFADLLKHFKLRTMMREIAVYKKSRAASEKYVNAGKIISAALISAFVPKVIYKKIYYVYQVSRRLPFSKKQLKEVCQRRDRYRINEVKQYFTDSMKCGMQALLHYEDRNSMAFSIESRVPFLDYKLAEAVFAMPVSHKIRNGYTKAVLRDGLKGILPDKIRHRYSKLGFVTPEDQWINHNNKQYREQLESACEALAPLVDKQRVMRWFDQKSGKVAREDFMIWRIICAGKWVRIFDVSME